MANVDKHAKFADKHGVSKDPIDNTNILAVLRAIEGVKAQIVSIAGTLRIGPQRIEQIKSSHLHDNDRLAIHLMDEWLRGANVMVDKPPYTLHKSDQHKKPSWWNLVWAVHHRNPAHAEKIAKKWNDEYKKPEKPGKLFESAPSDYLEIGNKEDVSEYLKPLHARWYHMGIAMSVPIEQLDAIDKQGLDAENNFKEMISKCLEEEERPSWKSLYIAASVSYGGNNLDFASRLFQKLTEEGSMGHKKSLPVGQAPSRPTIPPSDVQQLANSDKGSETEEVDFNFETDAFYKCAPETQKRRGLALIIANKEFIARSLPPGSQQRNEREENDRRMCAPRDAMRLRESLQNLGYEVVVKEDVTAEQIEQFFTDIQQGTGGDLHIRDNDESFICAVSSHGTYNNKIYGTYGKTVDLIATAYDKLGDVKCLQGRPKIFFIQACRGSKVEEILTHDNFEMHARPLLYLPTIAKRSDFFFSYATGPDTKAFKNNHGSIYITVLCNALKTFAPRLDLMYIVLTVHKDIDARMLTPKVKVQEGDKVIIKDVDTCMCPHLTTSMRDPFFFTEMARDRFEKSQQ